MRKLKYEIGQSPINIYTDRPNDYIGQLTDINVRLFLIGKYMGEISDEFTRVELVTPDIRPDFVLSQTKLENFDILRSFAKDYDVKHIHYETNTVPQNHLKGLRADVNVFASEFLAKDWGCDDGSVIQIGYTPTSQQSVAQEPYYIGVNIPVKQMSMGICPVVYDTPYVRKYIQPAQNGFIYRNQSEIAQIVNKLNLMDKQDVQIIGQNAKITAEKFFTKGQFNTSWKILLEDLI